jgi:hypothetical protein
VTYYLFLITVSLACSADRKWSRFVQQAIEVATPEEIVMVYKEIMPCVRTLAVDMFGNHAIQKVNTFPKFDPIGHKLGMTYAAKKLLTGYLCFTYRFLSMDQSPANERSSVI